MEKIQTQKAVLPKMDWEIGEIQGEGRSNDVIKQMMHIWEEAVKATHMFLTETDIESLKPIVENALLEIPLLLYIEDSEGIQGFMGIEGGKLEMLFISPDQRGNGLGKKMIEEAIRTYEVRYVDVNEQNPQAAGFYEHMGFQTTGRSEKDGQGNPFPLLHMSYYESR